MGAGVKRFEAEVRRRGKGAEIAVPFDPATAFGARDRYHVRGTVDGAFYRGELRPGWVLALGPAWVRDHPLADGQVVVVELSSEGPQVGSMAEDLAEALSAAPAAATFWASLPTFYRNNFLRWIESAKKPETRAKRIAETVQLLTDGRRERR